MATLRPKKTAAPTIVATKFAANAHSLVPASKLKHANWATPPTMAGSVAPA